MVRHHRVSFVWLACIMISFSCRQQKSIVPESFEIEKGFDLIRVASEPIVVDPVDLEFDEQGRAFVMEMPGYPMEDKESRIKLLHDHDGDGVYDSSSVYAEHLRMANSMMPYKKGMLVAAPPYLLFLKDTNADNKADAVDTIMGGFANGNLQHNYNGLVMGLDNWIYAANGGNSGKPYWWGDTATVMDMRGQDFRFQLDTKKMERLGESSGGYGLGMDPYGRFYETHNLEHVSHLVFPDRYINDRTMLKKHTLSNISDHEENGTSRIYPIGQQDSRVNHPEQSGYFSGSCGILHYGGGAFGEEYDQTVWVADVVLNLIHVDKITSDGASFKASRMHEKKEFMASTDRSFRPVNMSVGPDGFIYVIDMHRKVIEHPEWIPDEIEDSLDLDAGKTEGRIYRINKNGSASGFEVDQFKTNKGLVNALSHPNQWVRMTAHQLLMGSSLSDEVAGLLKQTLASNNSFSRLHAMWILSLQGKLTTDQLLSCLSDKEQGIRENALKVAEQYLNDDKILSKVMVMLSDKDQRVRMQAALGLSTLPGTLASEKEKLMLQFLIQATDQFMDDWNVMSLVLAVKEKRTSFFDKLINDKKNPDPRILSSIVLSINDQQELNTILQSLEGSSLPASSVKQVLKTLSGMKLSSYEGLAIMASLEGIEKNADPAMLSSIAVIRNQLGLPPSLKFITASKKAIAQVLNKELSDSLRLEQMFLVKMLPFKEKEALLFQCLRNTEPLQIQEEAIRQLSEERDPKIGYRIVEMWKELGPQTRRYASDLLLYIEIHHDALLTGLEKGVINIGEMNFDLERRRTLLWWTDNTKTKQRAAKLFSDAGVVNRQQAIEKMKPALTLTGNADQGAVVFANVCANCHVYGSKGNSVGPALTEINRKSKEAIMHEILDPNSAVDTRYISHRLETRSGGIHIGIVALENDRQVTIKKMGGTEITVLRGDIKQLSSLGTSLMMEGLEGSLTQQQMADLLHYLQKGAN
jgi:putative membrane-bound dehydrogenase-like protein